MPYASAPCKLTISSYLFARWHLFRHVGYLRHQQQVDLLTLKTGVRVTCDVGYLCANFSHSQASSSRVQPDVRDRQTLDRRQTKASLNASALWGEGITNCMWFDSTFTGFILGNHGDLIFRWSDWCKIASLAHHFHRWCSMFHTGVRACFIPEGTGRWVGCRAANRGKPKIGKFCGPKIGRNSKHFHDNWCWHRNGTGYRTQKCRQTLTYLYI